MRALERPTSAIALLAIAALSMAGCAPTSPTPEPPAPQRADPHSFARPDEVAVRHLILDLDVDFAARRIHGRATLEIDNAGDFETLYLDTAGLEIAEVVLEPGDEAAEFSLGPETPYLGRELAVAIDAGTRAVTIAYSTSPDATAIQWLDPAQTLSGRHPFLFTQSQSIYARTWIPCQDSPGVRTSYEAVVRVPPGLMALMSAENGTEPAPDGIHHFAMSQPVPSYLLALAVGELEFRPTGPRTGVYAEPDVVDSAAWEFAGLEASMEATESLFGPYRWERFDILVLPPSFPYGGMENPRLTFATPTILAGDRSLFSLVAHELAHSWSGNLVTNASWNDFWLNEGFTTYLEYRIMEVLEGPGYAEMLRELGRQDLLAEIEEIGPTSPDTRLALDLAGRDPEDGSTGIAYEKGNALLALLEKTWGRERWDAFLRGYFDAHAFRSLDTAAFVAYLEEELLSRDPELARTIRLDEWIHGPGLPDNAVPVASPAFALVEEQVAAWRAGRSASRLTTEGWSTHEWLHFVRHLPDDLDPDRMAELDAAFGFTTTGNSEIAAAWLRQTIRHGYAAADPALEAFLLEVGRSKFLRPLYGELATTPEGLERARRIYARARSGYHPLARVEVERVLAAADGG